MWSLQKRHYFQADNKKIDVASDGFVAKTANSMLISFSVVIVDCFL